ncbi:MAG TPA: bifunctional riboflavin kinase/FAD synthetase [Naasia sp.]|jgi:riboflavin kinase/FMN adenylyltransferase
MILVEDPSGVPAELRPSAVTIGKFDGVHTGHRAVLAQLKEEAAGRGLPSVVVTFDRNPLAVLRPELCPANVVSVRQKLELLEQEGVDGTLLLRFDTALAAWTPERFVSRVLVEALEAKVVLVGADFRFGARGAGDRALLEELGRGADFEVVVVDDVSTGGARASSSRVRTLLGDGDVEGAAELLGRAPRMRGVVVPGLRRGRELGYPTANLEPDAEGFAPGDGVYAGRLIDHSAAGAPVYPAAISVGTNPTFGDVARKQVEAYVLDEDIDLYGHVVEIEFLHRLRGMVAYHGVEPLREQMARDVEQTRELVPRS